MLMLFWKHLAFWEQFPKRSTLYGLVIVDLDFGLNLLVTDVCINYEV